MPNTSAPAAGRDERLGEDSSDSGFCFQEAKLVSNLLPILHQPLNTFREEILHSSLNLLLVLLQSFSGGV